MQLPSEPAKPKTDPNAVFARPLMLDYLLVLFGVAVSQFLLALPLLSVEPRENIHELAARWVVPHLTGWLRLTEGVVLLWPIFLTLQRIRGRSSPLTLAEWLWVIAWLGAAVLAGVAVWKNFFFVPEMAQPYLVWVPFVWYVIVAPSMAGIALILGSFDLVAREPRPWTHTLALALMLWPALPVAMVLSLGKFA